MINANAEIDYTRLTRQILTGNKCAEDILVRKFHGSLVIFLGRYTNDRSRAEDFTHDTLIIILQKLRKEALDDADKLHAYIFRTARYVYLGWLRRRENQHTSIPEPDALQNPEPGIEACCIQEQEFGELRDSINGLRMSRDREILQRRFLAQETKPEICEALSLSCEHYDRVLSRARKRLLETARCQMTV